MPPRGPRRTVPGVSTSLTLRAVTEQRDATRWLRPLAPVVLLVVALAAFRAQPAPGLHGRELAISIALGGFGLAGLGVLASFGAPGKARIAVVCLLATSAALCWLQPEGRAVGGLFVGVSLLAPISRARFSVPLTLGVLLLMSVGAVATGHGSLTDALLDAILVGAFYGMSFLALRLEEANRRAEGLVVELEQSRDAEARAAGLAERQRLAREMHDVLAHSLSGLLLQLEGARMLAAQDATDPRLPQAVARAHQLGKTGMEEARRAIGMLRDDELPGPERLPGFAAQFEQDHGVPCRLTVSGEAHELGSEARLALYRIAQEALTNIVNHAKPHHVELQLRYEPSFTRLTVEDFAKAERTGIAVNGAGGGYGLTGMRERAELLGGTLTAGPTPCGFRVELAVPT